MMKLAASSCLLGAQLRRLTSWPGDCVSVCVCVCVCVRASLHLFACALAGRPPRRANLTSNVAREIGQTKCLAQFTKSRATINLWASLYPSGSHASRRIGYLCFGGT